MADAYFKDTVARDRDLQMRNYMAARFAGKVDASGCITHSRVYAYSEGSSRSGRKIILWVLPAQNPRR